MRFFGKYLKQQCRLIAVYLLFCVVFLVSFLLYHLPAGAVLYPALLCSLLGVLIFLARFYHALHKHRTLQRIAGLSAAVMDEMLVDAETTDDSDYCEIIRHLRQEQRDLVTAIEQRCDDMMEYYTIWVHQIKTPIASMRLRLQNEDTELSRKLTADLFRIEQYVEMVLTFLRLDADGTDYVIRPCDIDVLIRQTVRKFAGDFIGRKLQLLYNPVSVTAVTDEKWLTFVLEQVLSNALKYTPSGSIYIEWEEPKTLCIRDTGIGIAPEDLPRIFEKGYTGYNGRADRKASGIGLYLCRRICKNLGHTITAESVPDQGTVIRICLSQDEAVKE